jgi:hypothetical protein
MTGPGTPPRSADLTILNTVEKTRITSCMHIICTRASGQVDVESWKREMICGGAAGQCEGD